MTVRILTGDCRDVLRTLPDGSVHCAVSSPPYWGLRDYGVDGQIGLERLPDAYVAEIVAVAAELRRVLRNDGTLWLNLGDSYCNTDKWGGGGPNTGKHTVSAAGDVPSWAVRQRKEPILGVKPKDLVGIPWRVAFALQTDGWWLRQDIIWAKPNPMPESVTDRCTRAHEYIFLLSKSARYYFDATAIAEPAIYAGLSGQDKSGFKSAGRFDGKHAETGYRTNKGRSSRDSFRRENSKRAEIFPGQSCGTHRPDRPDGEWDTAKRNKRDVWEIATAPYSEAHFATFPPALIEPCILAGCPEGGTVLDPFFGAGTTGLVCDRLNRNCIGIELNPEYAALARKRIEAESPLFADVAAA